MREAFFIKQNDTRPALYAQLLQDGSPVDLTGCTVRFNMSSGLSREAIITDATNGCVRYDWQEGDTAVPGVYAAEFEVTFPDGTRETFPNDGFLEIVITREVA